MIKKILLPIDHTDEKSWKKALPVALEQAEFYDAALTVISVIPEIIQLPNLPANYGDGAAAHVKSEIRNVLDQMKAHAIPVEIAEGSIYREILKLAHKGEFDMIVIASSKGRRHIMRSVQISPESCATRIAQCWSFAASPTDIPC